MDSKDRAALIRKGNELFNAGKLLQAEEIFVKTGYKDGLIRIGDYFYYDRKQPLYAYKYYKLAGCSGKISEIFDRMVFALNEMIHEDDEKNPDLPEERKIHLEVPKVHPKLKILAEEILRRNEEEKKR
ncbi:MAG: hypothetical protein JW982_09090 [Spirochaetes bacterium]|nr:hypothetical protein [Spirochaetota bacterium]